MAGIVLRVRLISGGQMDVTYEEAGAAAGEVVEHVIPALAQDDGTLRASTATGSSCSTPGASPLSR